MVPPLGKRAVGSDFPEGARMGRGAPGNRAGSAGSCYDGEMNEQRATEILDGALRKLLTPAGLDFYVILRQQYLEERAKLDRLSLREQHREAAELWGVLS